MQEPSNWRNRELTRHGGQGLQEIGHKNAGSTGRRAILPDCPSRRESGFADFGGGYIVNEGYVPAADL